MNGALTVAVPADNGASVAAVSLTGAFSMGFGLGFDAEMASALTTAEVSAGV